MTIPLSCLAHVKRRPLWLLGTAHRPAAPPVHVDVEAVMDRSGSMASLLSGATAGVRHFLIEQKNRRDGTYVECVTFDDVVEIPYSGPASQMLTADVEKCVHALTARGLTRLFDTAIEAIGRQTARLEKWRSSLSRSAAALHPTAAPIFFLLTDGHNNRGLADAPAFKRAVEKFKRDWKATMIFVAANMDAMSTGQQFGFSPETCLQMDHDAVHAEAAFRSATAATQRGASGAPPAIPQMDRAKSGSAWSQRHRSAPAPLHCPVSSWTPSLARVPQNVTTAPLPVPIQNVIQAGTPPPPPPFLRRHVARVLHFGGIGGGGGRGQSNGQN